MSDNNDPLDSLFNADQNKLVSCSPYRRKRDRKQFNQFSVGAKKYRAKGVGIHGDPTKNDFKAKKSR